ncbi:DNL zinc finger-domain-containing protein [Xylariaceae sp. FL0662B]|nr:DNL zinc finger-domain-containing protein [Xylariaceae sp. FL0662B]
MASRSILRLLNPILRSSKTISPSIFRPYPRLPRTLQPATRRLAHSIPKPPPRTPPSDLSQDRPRKRNDPHYRLSFTCVPCNTRSTHFISKQGYHKGSVLITCPECRNRHIISDHLKIFGSREITVEDLVREKGQLVKKGTLGEDGDIEFWPDEAPTPRRISSDKTPPMRPGGEDQLDDLASREEKRAVGALRAKNPSTQSTEPADATSSTPLGSAGTRPTVDGTHQLKAVPSTRRSYSAMSKGSIVALRLRMQVMRQRPKPPVMKVPAEVNERAAIEEHYGPYKAGNVGRHPLNRVSLEEHKKNAYRYAHRSPEPAPAPPANEEADIDKGSGSCFDENGNLQVRRVVPKKELPPLGLAPFDGIRKFARPFRRVMSREPAEMEVPKVRYVTPAPGIKSVRTLPVDTVDSRPLYVRSDDGWVHKGRRRQPGRDIDSDNDNIINENKNNDDDGEKLRSATPAPAPAPPRTSWGRRRSSSELLLHNFSRATSDLWGDEQLSESLRRRIEQSAAEQHARERPQSHWLR